MTALRHYVAVVAFTLLGAAAIRAQGTVEAGTLTSGSAGVANSVKLPIPGKALPGTASGEAHGASSNTKPVSAATPEVTARMNRQFFQDHSGPGAAQISLRTVPDHAEAWIDGKFVGPTPLDLKLAPGHHQVLVRATNMQQSTQEFDLAAKQTQPINFTLKPGNQSVVVLNWPQKK